MHAKIKGAIREEREARKYAHNCTPAMTEKREMGYIENRDRRQNKQ